MRVDQAGGRFVLKSLPMLPELKAHPEIAAARKQIADAWRLMRRQDPKIARLVRKRMQVATLAAVRQHWGLGC